MAASDNPSASAKRDEGKRRLREPEIQVAAAALTAAVSPPLGLAVAAGAALRSPRVRGALRKGTVQALAGAIQVGEQLGAAAERMQGAAEEPPGAAPPDSPPAPRAQGTANGRRSTGSRKT